MPPSNNSRAEADSWMAAVLATDIPTENVYDSCPQVVKKIKECLTTRPGMTKAAFCRVALMGANNNSLTRLMAGKKQSMQGTAVYPLAYAFFEKLRVMEGAPKSKARRKNEQDQGAEGFCTKSQNIGRPGACFYVSNVHLYQHAYRFWT